MRYKLFKTFPIYSTKYINVMIKSLYHIYDYDDYDHSMDISMSIRHHGEYNKVSIALHIHDLDRVMANYFYFVKDRQPISEGLQDILGDLSMLIFNTDGMYELDTIISLEILVPCSTFSHFRCLRLQKALVNKSLKRSDFDNYLIKSNLRIMIRG